ncbi:MAG: ThiF family adenylyltransferase, partial [Ruminococcus sp.]|nr:ThiF family adenylyltransferase [Ruminococcus sp.]
MINEFSRTELLLGEEAMNQLKNARVMVLGVGGVGSHCIEALARAGVGSLILVDNDTVSLTNINRQSIAFHSTVGKYKTKVMDEKIADICPSCDVKTFEMFVLPENIDSLFEEPVDYIIDAIDT